VKKIEKMNEQKKNHRFVAFLRDKDAILHRTRCHSVVYHDQHSEDMRWNFFVTVEESVRFARSKRNVINICQRCKPISEYRIVRVQ